MLQKALVPEVWDFCYCQSSVRVKRLSLFVEFLLDLQDPFASLIVQLQG